LFWSDCPSLAWWIENHFFNSGRLNTIHSVTVYRIFLPQIPSGWLSEIQAASSHPTADLQKSIFGLTERTPPKLQMS